MKKIENSFAVTGFVATDPEIKSFQTASVASFCLSISRTEEVNGEKVRHSALASVKAWRKNENTSKFYILRKGNLVTVKGYFVPEEWTSEDGKEHNRVVFNAVDLFEPEEQEQPQKQEKKKSGKKGK